MSAWLANLLTIPDWSLYAHDALHDPEAFQRVQDAPHPYKGIVDTGAPFQSPWGGLESLGYYELTVIDADPLKVADKVSRLFGRDMSNTVERIRQGMEALKPQATVYHTDDWDQWIGRLYKDHTGLDMDRTRYEALLGLNVQSQYARQLRDEPEQP